MNVCAEALPEVVVVNSHDRSIDHPRFRKQHRLNGTGEHELTAVIAARMGVDPLADPRPEILSGAAFAAYRVAVRRWSAAGGRHAFSELLDESLAALGAFRD